VSFLNFAWSWLKSPAQWHGGDSIPVRLLEHLLYSGVSLLLGALIAVPLGVLIGHTRRGSFIAVNMANVWRAIPTLGFLILMVLLTGFATVLAVPVAVLIPLVVLAIPPILVNTYEGVAGVDADLKDAALGMGMTQWQVVLRVELPVATPLIILGLRTAAIFVVSTATIAAEIGSGGLGRYIIDGLDSNNYGEVAGGAIVVVVLALAVQLLFVGVRRLVVPAGLQKQARASR
jgi:osmoprotectant transport system permease protein